MSTTDFESCFSETGVDAYHVVVADGCKVMLPRSCMACGSEGDVLIRRLETRAPRPGVHFNTWTGRPLRLPLCGECGTRIRNRLELPLVVWFFALPAAVLVLMVGFGGRLLPFPGIALTALIAVPIWLVRRWQTRQPLEFEVIDFKDEIDFQWAEYDRAAEFAAVNGVEVMTSGDLEDRLLDRETGTHV